jgi:sulfide dehydrogenase cytochrome subunit
LSGVFSLTADVHWQRRCYTVGHVTDKENTMHKRWIVAGGVAALIVGTAGPVQAQDPNAARALAATCFTCHGTEGRSVGGVPPSLAGQGRMSLLQQLKDFKEGKRPATVMHQQAKGYTDAQLELIAGYFASIKP